MGGPMVPKARARPDRIKAGATFHGSRMQAEERAAPTT